MQTDIKDPKYLVRHFVYSKNETVIFNTLFVSRIEMRKFISTLVEKHGVNLNYKVLTIFDCHIHENCDSWSQDEIVISE